MKVKFNLPQKKNSSRYGKVKYHQNHPLTGRDLVPSSRVLQNRSTKSITSSCKSIKFQQSSRRYDKLLQFRQKLMGEYSSLMKMYKTNEWKLFKIIQKELYLNHYIYPREVFSFIRNPQIQVMKSIKIDLFQNDLQKIKNFLTQFNTKKRIRQVQIMKQSMTGREKLIRQSADDRQYYKIYRKMRVPGRINNGFTIYDQFRNILENHNSTSEKTKVHEQLFIKLCDAEEGIHGLVKSVAEANQRKKTFENCRQSID